MPEHLQPYFLNVHLFLLDSIFKSATTQAADINRLHTYFLLAAGFILFVVIACTILILYKFRHKEGEQYQAKTLSAKWEILTIGVPMLLVIAFFIMTIRAMHRVLPSVDGRTPDVVITGHQFWWEANYPSQDVTTANEIHLPVGSLFFLSYYLQM
jgi:cytochrome c oxidase subunit II